jgi:hypothetical protein
MIAVGFAGRVAVESFARRVELGAERIAAARIMSPCMQLAERGENGLQRKSEHHRAQQEQTQDGQAACGRHGRTGYS